MGVKYFFILGLWVASSLATDNMAYWHEFKFKAGEMMIGHVQYLEDVTQAMVEGFEEQHVSGENFPMLDFQKDYFHNISAYKVVQNGTVDLHAGFVNSILEVTRLLSDQIWDKTKTSSVVGTDVYFRDVKISYNVEYETTQNETGFGTTMVTVPRIRFRMLVSENAYTKALSSSIDLTSVDCEEMIFETYPYDKNMQLAILAVEQGKEFCDSLKQSIGNWKLGEFLKKAVDSHGFPIVCYYCNPSDD